MHARKLAALYVAQNIERPLALLARRRFSSGRIGFMRSSTYLLAALPLVLIAASGACGGGDNGGTGGAAPAVTCGP